MSIFQCACMRPLDFGISNATNGINIIKYTRLHGMSLEGIVEIRKKNSQEQSMGV